MMRFPFQILLLVCLQQAGVAATRPNPPTNTIFKPTFLTGFSSYTAGTAFVCEFPEGQQLLLTAHHLLGSAGGFESELRWNELNQVIKLTVGISFHDTSVSLTSKRALLIDGARALDQRGLANDIAAFSVEPKSGQPTLKLAKQNPKVGDTVWLFGRQAGQSKTELLPTVVTSSVASELDYAFENKSVQLRGTSGAPVIDSEGAVVAINIGGTEHEGKLIGYGNPVASIRAHLARAIKK